MTANNHDSVVFAYARYAGGGDYYLSDFNNIRKLNSIMWEIEECETDMKTEGLKYLLDTHGDIQGLADYFIENKILDVYDTREKMLDFLRSLENQIAYFESLK